ALVEAVSTMLDAEPLETAQTLARVDGGLTPDEHARGAPPPAERVPGEDDDDPTPAWTGSTDEDAGGGMAEIAASEVQPASSASDGDQPPTSAIDPNASNDGTTNTTETTEAPAPNAIITPSRRQEEGEPLGDPAATGGSMSTPDFWWTNERCENC